MKIKAGHITIYVSEMDKSILFYESIGFTLQQRWDNHYAQMSAPGIEIGLHPATEDNLRGNSGNVSIGLTTDNFQETKSELEKVGIQASERKEEGGEFLHFTDPDGTDLYFIKPKW
jgi:catechol 2,3-dioxygenase-like lactoylglutathione lyase family enzyme